MIASTGTGRLPMQNGWKLGRESMGAVCQSKCWTFFTTACRQTRIPGEKVAKSTAESDVSQG
nr:hypothetical protein [Paenibacillus sp. yr247]